MIHISELCPRPKESKSLKKGPEYMQFFKTSQGLLMIKQVWGSKLNWNRFDVEKNKIPKKQRERNLY